MNKNGCVSMCVKVVPLGDSAITIYFGNEIDENIHHQINQFIQAYRREKINGVIDCVPAYTSVSIFYDPVKISYRELEKKIDSLYKSALKLPRTEAIVYKIPVYYGGESGPDLQFIAEYTNIPEQEVINLHANREYLIHMIGFVPGFPYLGGLPDKIGAPRLEIPRAKVAAGSVGIGGGQTGIYPSEVPSGWRIIGITPLTLFNIKNDPPSLLSAGNYVSFLPVEYDEYLSIKEQEAENKYELVKYKKGVE